VAAENAAVQHSTIQNTHWQLEEMADSLVVELDKTRETLAVRAYNKPLTYTVKEVALDLNVFPSYDGDQVRFVTAQPGQQGASKVSIQLNSITDQQVRATTKTPSGRNDLKLEQVSDVDKTTTKKLRTLGVSSVDDLKQLEHKNVDLGKVAGGDSIDYRKLANQISKTRRAENPPRISGMSLVADEDHQPVLAIRGRNLAVDPAFLPVAVVNKQLAEVMSSSNTELRVRITPNHRLADQNEVILTFDPFAVVRVNVKA
jgi:hypothetical protein